MKKEKKRYSKEQLKNGKKEVKPNTREISYNMFKEGRSLKEIAAERSLAISTIEVHLGNFVARGLIDISQLIDESKVKHIIDAFQELDTLKLVAVKKYLGNGYTYGEIRLVLGSYLSSQTPDNDDNN